jgi:outer membrane protein assembly factor BamB
MLRRTSSPEPQLARPPCGISFAFLLALAAGSIQGMPVEAVPADAVPADDSIPSAVSASSSSVTGWPQFRGPKRDGVSPETGLLRAWPEGGPAECWRRPLGEGFSAITVADGGLFTLVADAEHELAVRLDPDTGEEIWRTPIGPRFDEPLGNGPRSTPTWDGERLYVLSSTGTFHALRPKDGSKIWSVDAQKELAAAMPLRGFASSPLIDGDLVIVELGGADGRGVVAFDRDTGELRWGARDTPAGYASPLAVTIDGVHQVIHLATAGRELTSLLPDGSVYWTHPWPPGAIAMPVFIPPDRIFVSASADIGATVVKVHTENGEPVVEEVWKDRVMKNHFSSSVLYEGTLYGFDNGTLKALDPATGDQHWAKRGLGKGSLIAADGLLLVLTDRGKLVLVEATPDEFRELSSVQALTGKSWTVPTLAGGRIYLRNHQEIVCLEIAGKEGVDD